MGVSYKKLFKLLIDRGMKKKDLQEAADLSPAAVTNNFAVKIPADQLGKIIVLPIFYSANVNLETKTAVITVKENGGALHHSALFAV